MGIKKIDVKDGDDIKYDVVLDRSYYCMQQDIIDWCVHNGGKYRFNDVFGHTFITFYSEADRNWFLLRWA